jgi:hypothetical protein
LFSEKSRLPAIWVKPLLTFFTPAVAFSIGIFESVTEIHHTARVRAVRKAEGMTKLMDGFFHSPTKKLFFIGADTKAEKRNDCAPAKRFS